MKTYKIANIKLDINSKEGVVSTCKAWDDRAKEAKREGIREGAILSAIDAWRDVNISEREIKARIMAKYNLTKKEAAEYMVKKSA